MTDTDQQPGPGPVDDPGNDASPRTVTNYEYMCIPPVGPTPFADIVEALNTYGAQGWLMCGTDNGYLFLARPTS